MTLRRALAGALLAGASLLVVTLAVVAFALSNETMAKKLIAIALGKSPKGLEIGEIRGPLKGPLILLHLKYRSGALSAEVDSTLIEWRPARLLLGRVEFERVHVTGVHLILPDSAPPDTAGLTHARMRQPVTPLPVLLGDVFISGISVDAPGGMSLRDGMLTLGGRLTNYRFAMTADGFLPPLGALDVALTGAGNLERVAFDSSRVALLNGTLIGDGALGWWPRIEWDLALRGDSLRPAPLLPHPSGWPGTLGLRARASGAIDEAGAHGRIELDSLAGRLRGQPVGGSAEFGFSPEGYELANAAVTWGSVRLEAQGTIRDDLALDYDLAIGDLRTAVPPVRGAVQLKGTLRGPRATPRVAARVTARNLVSGSVRLTRLAGRVDLDLADRGRDDVVLGGRAGGLGPLAFDTLVASLHGTRGAHRIRLIAAGPGDSLRAELTGSLPHGRWQGSLGSLALYTRALRGWRLERPTTLLATTSLVRVSPLCLAADSSAGRFCAEGEWRNSRTWTALATLTDLPARRLPFGALEQQGRILGTVGAHLDLRAVGGRLDGSARAATDSVALVWRKPTDQTEHRLALDSAVIELRADPRQGVRSNLGLALRSDGRTQVATLSGSATLAQYRLGAGLLRQPLTFSTDGNIVDLGFLQPFLFGLDSLKGGVTLRAAGTGSLAVPEFTATVGVANFVAGFPGRRAATGTLSLTASGALGRDRQLNTDVRLDARGFGYDYWYYAERRRLHVDSGSVVLAGDAAGLRGTIGFGVTDLTGKRVGSLHGELSLPAYTRLGLPLRPQPVELTLAAEIPDLAALQPLMMSVDSLAGVLRLNLAMHGRVGTPTATATLALDSARGRLPSGTMAAGGLSSELELAVANDRSFTGSLSVDPHDASFRYPVGSGTGLMRLAGNGLTVRGAPDGVHGTLDVAFSDSAGATMGTLKGQAALPGFIRIDEPLARQPVEATLEGRVADFAFLEAFTPEVDSAAGKVTLDAKLYGLLSDARLVGGLELKDVAMRMPLLGILLEDVQFRGEGDAAGDIRVRGSLRSGGGALTLSGATPVQPSGARPGHLHLEGDHFEAMDNAELHAVLSGALDVRIAEDSLDVRGAVTVPLARLMLTEIPVSAVAPSDDVILLDSLKVLRRKRPLSVNVGLTLGDSVSFSGFNFNAELGGSLVLAQRPNALPTGSGILYIEEGHYRAYGQDLTIRNGEVRFGGGPVDNPALAIRATRTGYNGASSVLAGIRIAGTLHEPDVSLFSEPPMSESEVLSYILTGGPTGSGMGGSLWDKALTSLGLRGGDALSGTLTQQVGLNQARLSTSADIRGTALVLGKFLTPNLYVGYGIGVFDPISTLRLRYVLSNHFTLLAEAGRVSSADALVKVEGGKSKSP